MMQPKTPIMDLSLTELTAFLIAHGLSPARAPWVLRHVYRSQANSFDDIPDVGAALLQMLQQRFSLARLPLIKEQHAADGTRKFLFRLKDGEQIESVLIPEKNHYTLCISSQVGCARNCRFCLTGKDGFRRNLTQGEIVSQVRDVFHMLTDTTKPLTNVVFMGMGEPLDNYANVLRAIDVLTDNSWGLRLAARNITVSTAGIVPRIYDLGRDTKVRLAVSLNGACNKTRAALMPVNKEYPLETLLNACRHYPLSKGQRIIFEYILIHNVNDSASDAAKLAELLRGLPVKINLIPFNEHAGVAFKRPDTVVVRAFADIMCDKYKYTAIVRYSKGREIAAACGQLKAGA